MSKKKEYNNTIFITRRMFAIKNFLKFFQPLRNFTQLSWVEIDKQQSAVPRVGIRFQNFNENRNIFLALNFGDTSLRLKGKTLMHEHTQLKVLVSKRWLATADCRVKFKFTVWKSNSNLNSGFLAYAFHQIAFVSNSSFGFLPHHFKSDPEAFGKVYSSINREVLYLVTDILNVNNEYYRRTQLYLGVYYIIRLPGLISTASKFKKKQTAPVVTEIKPQTIYYISVRY
jgi:hypothetical protein